MISFLYKSEGFSLAYASFSPFYPINIIDIMAKTLININHLYQPSAFTRLAASIIKSLPKKALPVANVIANAVGRVVALLPIEYNLGGARALASGKDTVTPSRPGIQKFEVPQLRIQTWEPAQKDLDFAAARIFPKPLNLHQSLPGQMRLKGEANHDYLPHQLEKLGSRRLDEFPLGVQEQVRSLIEETNNSNGGKRFEYACVLIVADGEILGAGNNVISSHENEIGFAELRFTRKRAFDRLKQINQRKGKITIFVLHTHPASRSYGDQLFTALSATDTCMTDLMLFNQDVQTLRRKGFKGEIEFLECAIPAVAGKIPENDKIHIAVYKKEEPAVEV
jgi:hypothetical protein